jgi:type I restriction enzyme S subunit
MKISPRAKAEVNQSGIPWFPEKPAGWKVLRTKWLFDNKKELNQIGESAQILSLTLRGVVENDPENPEGLVPKDYNSYQIFKKGDLVFKLIDLENFKTSRVGLVHKDGIMSPAYVRLVPRSSISVDYFYLQFYSLYLQGVYNKLGSGVRSTLGPSDLGNIPILVPPLEEQQKIVSFIQQQDRRIRKFIRNKKRLIGLHEERRQKIVERILFGLTQAGGGQRFSGEDWLGQVSSDWDITRIKYLYTEVDARSIDGSEELLSLRMYEGLVPHTSVSDKPITPDDLVGYKKVVKGDLVLNRMRAAIGILAVSPSEGLVSPDYAVFRPRREFQGQYFAALFKTYKFKAKFRLESRGLGTGSSGFMRLYSDRFTKLLVPLPPVEAQAAMLSEIEEQCRLIDRAVLQTRREILLVEEYRNCLIADAVTGKIDLRSFQPTNEEETPDTDADLSLEDSDELNEDYSEDEELLAEAVNAN